MTGMTMTKQGARTSVVVADVDGRLVAVVVQQLQGGLSRLSDAARRLSWKCQVPLLPAGDEDDEPGLLLARLLVSLPALLHSQPPICPFSAAQPLSLLLHFSVAVVRRWQFSRGVASCNHIQTDSLVQTSQVGT